VYERESVYAFMRKKERARDRERESERKIKLRQTATQCNRLKHTATYTATHFRPRRHGAKDWFPTYCNTPCNTPCNASQAKESHRLPCNTLQERLQQTARECNTLQERVQQSVRECERPEAKETWCHRLLSNTLQHTLQHTLQQTSGQGELMP